MRASAAPYTLSDAPQLCLVVVVCIFLCVRRVIILIIVTMLGRVGGFTLLSATELTLKRLKYFISRACRVALAF